MSRYDHKIETSLEESIDSGVIFIQQLFIVYQKKDTNNRPSETRNRRKKRKKIINKTSYFLYNSLNKSLNQMLEQKIKAHKEEEY